MTETVSGLDATSASHRLDLLNRSCFQGSGDMATTDTMPTTTGVMRIEQPQDTQDACVACAHPWSAHDVISARFCTATVAAGLVRGCVCPDE